MNQTETGQDTISPTKIYEQAINNPYDSKFCSTKKVFHDKSVIDKHNTSRTYFSPSERDKLSIII